MTVQFSGGEPTISPIFLEAVAYARDIGYFSAQAATNGIRFAQDPGVRDGRRARPASASRTCSSTASAKTPTPTGKSATCSTSSCARSRTSIAAGIDIALVVTIVRTVNDDQVGRIIKFAVENCDKISFVSFQPVSFTGRDEDIDDATRAAQRYTLSHLAEDVKRQTGATEPLRDWFPLSAAGAVSDVTDLLNGPGADWGTMKCGCHPELRHRHGAAGQQEDEGMGAARRSVLNVERFLDDARHDHRRGAQPAC